MENGQYLTRELFRGQLNTILQEAGLNAKDYNTHSFRIGAATTAHEAGIVFKCWVDGKVMHTSYTFVLQKRNRQNFQVN